MNPLDFMQTALRLSAGDEASKRSAISRAYYCAYHIAYRLLASCGVRFSRGFPQHESIIRCLQYCLDPLAERAGRLLKSLRTARNDADYDLDNRNFTAQSRINFHLTSAQELLTALESISPAVIAPRVREYATSILKLAVDQP